MLRLLTTVKTATSAEFEFEPYSRLIHPVCERPAVSLTVLPGSFWLLLVFGLSSAVSALRVPLNRPSLLSCEVHLLGLSLLQPKGSYLLLDLSHSVVLSCLSFVGEISFRSFFDFY